MAVTVLILMTAAAVIAAFSRPRPGEPSPVRIMDRRRH
jgi:hypothetical protein